MYRMLIVDDETIIADGLSELFEDKAETYGIEVFRAYSGTEAWRIMDRQRIDVLLTDIQMPGMTGLELLRKAKSQWPNCQVIMLTGYNDFGYVQEALRLGSLDYVLKTEGDGKILAAAERALGELGRKGEASELLRQAKEQLQLSEPVLIRERMTELLEGRRPIREALRLLGETPGLGWHPDGGREAMLVLGRIDEWRPDLSGVLTEREEELLVYATRNIAEEYMNPRCRHLYVRLGKKEWAWLVQDKAAAGEENGFERFSFGCMEGAQHQSEALLGTTTSYLLGRVEGGWEEMPDVFSRMKESFRFGGGLDREMTLGIWHREGRGASEQGKLFYSRYLSAMENAMESGDLVAFRKSLGELVSESAAYSSGKPELAREVFAGLSHTMLPYVGRLVADDGAWRERDIERATDFHSFGSWQEIETYYGGMAERIVKLRENGGAGAGVAERDPVLLAKRYIAQHLAGDVSLSRLGEEVYLNPFYLSRLFKRHTGVSITTYVIHARIEKAKELLRSTNRRVNDIALEVGFESASYFTRFFKRITGMTPVEYRDKG